MTCWNSLRFSTNKLNCKCLLICLASCTLFVIYAWTTSESIPPPKSSTFQKGNGTNLILIWTTFYDTWDWQVLGKLKNCPLKNNCELTMDRTRLLESNALLFHCRDIDLTDMPHSRYPLQRWIFFCLEPPTYSYFLGFRFMQHIFNWTMTYRLDSDIIATYGSIKAKYASPLKRRVDGVETKINRSYASTPEIFNWNDKTKMAYWLVSHCETSSRREAYVDELLNKFPVEIYGQCGIAICPRGKTVECQLEFSKRFKFMLAFENSLCKDYVTEKFFVALNYNAIPIVFGGAPYELIAPPYSYINARKFKSPIHLANYLEKVASNEKLYGSFFEWRKLFVLHDRSKICNLCTKLTNPGQTKSYEDIIDWWVRQSNCSIWSN